MRKRLFVLFISIISSLCLLTSCKKTYTVIFNVNGGDTTVEAQSVKKGSTVSKPNDPTQEGYKFLYWEYNGAEFDFNTEIVENITLYAIWEQLHVHEYNEEIVEPTCTDKGYTIFNCECGDTYIDNYTDMLEHSYTVEEVVEPTCQNQGYTVYSCECGDTYNDNYTDVVDHVYENGYCKWCNDREIIIRAITFDTDGGNVISPIIQEVGTPVNEPSNPEKEGYEFLGWYLEDVLYEFTTMPSDNITLVAKYIKLYTVTVYLNNGEETNVYEVRENTTLYDLDELVTPSYAGHRFGGFYYADDFKVEMKPRVKITSNIELHAKWDKIYYINYDLNGGSTDVEFVGEYIAADLEYSYIELKHPYKEGYYFRGWYNSPTFEGNMIYRITSENIQDYHLYAKWQEAKLENAYVSILGDSISAFEGIIPSGFTPCYCYTKANGCLTLNDMWWKIVQKELGFKQGIINAYAGTTIMKAYGPTWATELEVRLKKSLPANRMAPDVMLIYMGNNDALVDGLNIADFEQSYRNMLNNLYKLYPGIQIFVSTVSYQTNKTGAAAEQRTADVNATIIKLAKEYNLPVMDFANAYGAADNALYDSIHPNATGMKLLADKAIEAMKEFYNL